MPGTNLPHPEERCGAARLEARTAPVRHSAGTGSASKIVVIRVLVLLLIAITLAGCGKKGAPQPPPDEPNTFPRSYPNV
jgi:predicted small lipoprotein YifL